jgi:diketogulonate reductase-like aldo/keto reductase
MALSSTTSTTKTNVNNNNNDNDDNHHHHLFNRRRAIQQAGIVGGGSLLLPNTAYGETAATTFTKNIQPVTALSDGSKFPLVSFGLQIYDDNTAYRLTLLALECGYRNFFASVLAGNQRGFAKAIRDSGVPRNELYVCGSVVSNRVATYSDAYALTTKGWKNNLQAFGAGDFEYLDQIMLDYPGPDREAILGQWKSFEEMHSRGYAKSLSVSNFSPSQLDCILKNSDTSVKPVVNQLPYSVAYHPGNVIEDNTRQRNVLVQAWAPLGGSLGGRFNSSIKKKCQQIGKKYDKSYAQVTLVSCEENVLFSFFGCLCSCEVVHTLIIVIIIIIIIIIIISVS